MSRATLTEYLTDWLAATRVTLAPTAWANYDILLRRYVMPRLGTHRLDQLKPNHLSSLYADLRVDLGDRLLHLNTAFCVFAVLWELDERTRTPQAVAWTDRSHPPVDLRYDRFRNFQRELSMRYDTRLVPVVDSLSLRFLQVLTEASPYFGDLARLTPLLFRTPSMDEMERYEQHLLRLEPAIATGLELHGFIPAEFLDAQE